MDVWFGLRRLRFSPGDAENMALVYREVIERDHTVRPWGIAGIVCARFNLSHDVWQEPFAAVFTDSRKLVRA
jgi:hypothetical protein